MPDSTHHDRSPRRQAWSSYWATGRLHSCATSFDGNYEGAIGASWRQAFSALPAGTRVLDLATGNGPLPALLWELYGDAVQVDAVDLAGLAPTWHDAGKHASIRFHPGVDMEALPFADASFDLVTSQFGFEYADHGRTLAEVCRVAAPGASLRLVMHHHGSRLVEVGREEELHHAWLSAPEGLLEAARGVIPVLAAVRAGRPPDMAAVQAREAYNRAMAALGAAAEASSAPDLLLETRDVVHRLVRDVGADPVEALHALELLAGSLEQARLRTAEMIACALDRPGIEALARTLSGLCPQARIAFEELAQAEGVLGWAFSADGIGASAG